MITYCKNYKVRFREFISIGTQITVYDFTCFSGGNQAEQSSNSDDGASYNGSPPIVLFDALNYLIVAVIAEISLSQ